ncbi:low affinity iron permease family protein [soil metagenome]
MSDRTAAYHAYHGVFARFATWVSHWAGSPTATLVAVVLVIVGLVTIGIEITVLSLSVVTLLMVFVIQNTQHRDSLATQVKLDELIEHLSGAREELTSAEALPAHEIADLKGPADATYPEAP